MDSLPSAPSPPAEPPDEIIARLTAELREARDQQAATTEIIEIINRSPGDLAPVFDAILEKAHSLCGAEHGALATYDGEYFRAVALHAMPEPFGELLRQPFRTSAAGSAQRRLLQGERLIHIPDVTAVDPVTPIQHASIEAGIRTLLVVPLRKDNRLLGYITANRREVRPFSDKQIALLQNFAAQAVIAMENARLLTETREALEQQTATAEVLQVINSSPGDLAPVFEIMLERAMHLCGASFGMLHTYEGDQFHGVAARGVPPAFAEYLVNNPLQPRPGSFGARILSGEPLVHVTDVADDELYRSGDPQRRALVELGGARTTMLVALTKDRALLGTIQLYRQHVQPFSEKQIALLQNFAAQAVIAMENARLITETREALEQQTATAEVLQVINSSPGDLAPVFNAMLAKAFHLCEGVQGSLWTFHDGQARFAAARGLPAEFIEILCEQWERREPSDHHPMSRLMRGERVVQLLDIATSELYLTGDPTAVAAVELGRVRTLLFVALLKDAAPFGAFIIARREVRPFTEKQIALVENFAAQAVIAMENARLLTETREALEQQTATAEVLQVINSSPGALQPVFDSMLAQATRLCEATYGHVRIYDGIRFHLAAVLGDPQLVALHRQRPAFEPGVHSPITRTVRGERIVHIPDAIASNHYRDDPPFRELADSGICRAMLLVALQKDDALLGFIAVYREEAGAFSERQIALLQNFAAQAVIAMENARLLTETREALEQQTATAEVLQVINSSPGDLAPVSDAILEKAHALCDAPLGSLVLHDGEQLRAVATKGYPQEFDILARDGFAPTEVFGRLLSGELFVQNADSWRTGPDDEHPMKRAAREIAGVRTVLFVPLRKDAKVLGYISAQRQEVRPFTEKQIALLQNFAAQAVIAMENARLLTETREALEQQTATAEVLQVINSSPGDLSPVFDAILEKAHSLCGVARGSLELYDGENLRAVATRGWADDFADQLRQGYPASDHPATRPLIEGRPFSQILDVTGHESPFTRGARSGARTLLCVPLRRDDRLLGIITSGRVEVRPFTDKQIALLQNFAAQAVVAMENARLLTETREALEQQTATAEVLQVINSSPGELTPVFDAMLEKMVRLCQAAHGHFLAYDGMLFHPVAIRGEPRFAEFWRQGPPFQPQEGNPFARLVRGEHLVHDADAREDDAYRDIPEYRRIIDSGVIRTSLTVPLRKAGVLLGAVRLYRQEVRPFTEKQIALVENFAQQAVIAMENARLLTATREALEQQTATAEVLQVINSSPGELAPVFDAILEKAHNLCDAAHGNLWTYDGELFHPVATRGNPRFADWLRDHSSVTPAPGTVLERIVRGEDFLQIADAANDQACATSAYSRQVIEVTGARTTLIISLRKNTALLGVIFAYRQEVRPFSEKQIALFKNFAAQAVIAMENARLLGELRERTHDLEESLEYQTATSSVLEVINSSPGDLVPVFDAILAQAHDLCGAPLGSLVLRDGEQLRAVATRGHLQKYKELARQGFPPTPPFLRMLSGEPFVHVLDSAAPSTAADDHPMRRAAAEIAGIRTVLFVPLRKDAMVLGYISAQRQEVRPFSDKQIALLQNFAAQAVIAMENARLLTETREALEQQTATAEVLQVINSSPGDLAPVFDAMLEKAIRVCDAEAGVLCTYDGESFWPVAHRGFSEFPRDPIRSHPETGSGRLALGEDIVHILDSASGAPVDSGDPGRLALLRLGGARTQLAAALRTEQGLIGTFTIWRREVRPFSDKQIALLQNFAAQAVIAMENARLLTETREALEQQTATAEVLQVINSSPGDLAPVFDAMLEKATRLCNAAFGILQTYDGDHFHAVALHNVPSAFAEFAREPARPVPGGTWERMLAGEPLFHEADLADSDLYRSGISPVRRAFVDLGGARTSLRLALRKDATLLGMFNIYRQEVRPFSDKEIALLQNFAAQAVIAMENARLITETREALQQQTGTAEVLQVINSSPGDLTPVFDAMLEKAMRLCGAAFGILNTYDGKSFHRAATRGVPPAYDEWRRGRTAVSGPGTGHARIVAGEDVVHNLDLMAEPAYRGGDPDRRAFVELAGARTGLIVALRKEGALLGVIRIYRREVRPFSDKQIALLQNFAAQAVIAMENARLLTETREALEQQTATAEVLQVINSSPGDLAPVFEAILEKAHSLSAVLLTAR